MRYFSCSWRMTKIASVVPLPGTNPNCDSSIVTTCLMRLSAIISVTFIACSVNFSPLKLPRSRAYHPFPCYGRRNEALLPVRRDLHISIDCYGEVSNHVSTSSPAALTISTTTPDGPAVVWLQTLSFLLFSKVNKSCMTYSCTITSFP